MNSKHRLKKGVGEKTNRKKGASEGENQSPVHNNQAVYPSPKHESDHSAGNKITF